MKKMMILISVIILSLYFNSCEHKKNIVAEAREVKITASELKDQLTMIKNRFHSKPFTQEEKLAQLQTILKNKAEFVIARQEGILDSPLVQLRTDVKKEELLFRAFQDYLLNQEIMNDKILKKYYHSKFRKVEYKQILLSHILATPIQNNRGAEDALRMADSLKILIQNGVSFDDLAARFSDDATTRSRNGYVGWVAFSDLESAVADALEDAQPGQVVGPVRSRFGYHLILLLKRKDEQPEKPYAAVKNEIRTEYERKRQMQIRKVFMDRVNGIIKQAELKINREDARILFELMQEWIKKPIHTTDELLQQSRHLVLFRGNHFEYSATKFILMIQNIEKAIQNMRDLSHFYSILENGLPYMASIYEAKRLGLDRSEEFKESFARVCENIAIAELHNHWRRMISNTEEELQKYYQEHGEEFRSPEKIEIWAIAIRDKKKADEVYSKLKRSISPTNFEKFAGQYSEIPAEAKSRGYLGFLSRQDRPELVSVALQYGPNQLIPPFKTTFYYYILLTGKKQDSFLRPYEKVKTEIDKKVFVKKFEDMRLMKIQQIYGKLIPVTINDHLLSRINP